MDRWFWSMFPFTDGAMPYWGYPYFCQPHRDACCRSNASETSTDSCRLYQYLYGGPYVHAVCGLKTRQAVRREDAFKRRIESTEPGSPRLAGSCLLAAHTVFARSCLHESNESCSLGVGGLLERCSPVPLSFKEDSFHSPPPTPPTERMGT